MLGAVSSQLSTMASNLNPYNWSQQTKSKVLNATAVMAIGTLAIAALMNLGVSAEKTANSDASYNAMRTAQNVVEGNTNTPLLDHVMGSVLGRPAVDGMNAGDKVYKETGSVVASVAANLFTQWESNRYQTCLDDNAESLLGTLFCHIFVKPTLV